MKLKKEKESCFVRSLSAAVLLVSLLLNRIATGSVHPQFVLYCLGLATLILLLVPRKGGANGMILPLDVISSAVCVVMSLLDAFPLFSPSRYSLLYSAILLSSLMVYMIANIWKMTRNMDFLCGKIHGWEVAVEYIRTSFSSLYLCAALVAIQISELPYTGRAVDVITVIALSLLYVVSFVRHLAGGGDNLSENMKARTRERIHLTLQPELDSDVSLNNRLLYARMKEYMETKRPYLAPDFAVEDLARALYSNEGYVSKMIYACTGKNFKRYINNYRVQYAMELFKKDRGLKVTELCQLSGFANKVTFNMAFKLVAGLTPGEWCRNYLEQTAGEKVLPSFGAGER